MSNRRRFRFSAWIACFAALLTAFVPAISHALASQSGGAWVEVCSTTGMTLVKVTDEQAPATPVQPDKSHHADHCPSCFAHGGAFVPAGTLALAVDSGAGLTPALLQHAPSALAGRTPGQPRAPPTLS